MPNLRPLSTENREWLTGELQAWNDAGLVLPAVADKILCLYESPTEEAQRRHHCFLISLGGLAALLLFAAAALVVSYNWQVLSPATKLGIVFGALAMIYSAAAMLWRANFHRVSEVVIFFGALFYGSAIWLIAQIFHMNAHYPDGYFWWAVGVLPLALIFDTLMLHALLATLVSTWVGTEIIDHGFFGTLFWGRHLPIANGAYLAPLMLLPGVWYAYKQNSLTRLAIYLPALVWWVCLQPIAWRVDLETAYFVAAVGCLLLILGESHVPRSSLAIAYRVLGALLIGGALVPLSYQDFMRWMMNDATASTILLALVIASLTGITTVAAEYFRYRALEEGNVKQADLFDDVRRRQWLPLSLAVVVSVLTLCGLWRGIDAEARDAGIAGALLANLAMIALSIWLMRVGVRDDRAQPFVAGVAYFLLWMILRYVDLFGLDAGMLGAAALFAACGLAIGGLAWFWQKRNEVAHVRT